VNIVRRSLLEKIRTIDVIDEAKFDKKVLNVSLNLDFFFLSD